jgi:hypothetical protein
VAADGGRDGSAVTGYQFCSTEWLSGSERNDAADGIVRGYTNGDAIAGDDFDSEAAHPAAQLRQHFVSSVALHTIQPAGVNRDDGSLHVNQIVFAQ